jgi:hypothetical protein
VSESLFFVIFFLNEQELIKIELPRAPAMPGIRRGKKRQKNGGKRARQIEKYDIKAAENVGR